MSRLRSIPPPAWVEDSSQSECRNCGREFTVLRRRHHCRRCGNIFCGECSKNSCPLPRIDSLRTRGPVRVCDACHSLTKEEENVEAILQRLSKDTKMEERRVKGFKTKYRDIRILVEDMVLHWTSFKLKFNAPKRNVKLPLDHIDAVSQDSEERVLCISSKDEQFYIRTSSLEECTEWLSDLRTLVRFFQMDKQINFSPKSPLEDLVKHFPEEEEELEVEQVDRHEVDEYWKKLEEKRRKRKENEDRIREKYGLRK